MLTMAKKQTRSPMGVRLNTVLLERLDAYADSIGRTRSDLVDRAIEEYLNKYASHIQPKPPKGKR